MEHRDRAGGPDEVERRAAAIGSEFGQVFLHHYPVLLRQAQRRLGSRVEAEDAVQDAFERAFRGYQAVAARGDLAVGAWLSRIVSNVCCDHYARRKREEQLFRRVEGSVRPAADVADQGVDPPLLRQLKSAVAGLPASHREAWVMRDVVGMDYPEVAEAAGISEVNARARVSRARASLQRRMHAVGVSAFAFPLALFGRMALRRRGRLDGGGGLGSGTGNVAAGASTAGTSVPAVAQQYLTQVIAAPSVQQVASGLNPLRGLAVAAAGVVAVGAGGGAIGVQAFGSGPSSSGHVSVGAPSAATTTLPPVTSSPAQVSTSTSGSADRQAASGLSDPVWSVSTTSTSVPTSTTAPPRSTPPTTAPSQAPPSWIGLALGQPSDDSPQAPNGSQAPAAASGAAPSTTAASAPATTSTTVAAPAPACPYPIDPAGVPAPPASVSSDQVFSTIQTAPVDLATVGSLPGFNVGTGLQMAGPDGAQYPVLVQMQACVPPVTGGISLGLVEDNMNAQASGLLVATVGDATQPGYLFRGTVNPEGPTLPNGITTTFVAQLTLDRRANTAQLTVAFIDTSGTRTATGGSSPSPATTTTTVPQSDPPTTPAPGSSTP